MLRLEFYRPKRIADEEEKRDDGEMGRRKRWESSCLLEKIKENGKKGNDEKYEIAASGKNRILFVWGTNHIVGGIALGAQRSDMISQYSHVPPCPPDILAHSKNVSQPSQPTP